MRSIMVGERVLVTGGTGSLGHALAKRLAERGAKVRIFSRDEKKQYEMQKRFPEYNYRLGDIRDPSAVRDAVRDIDTVIHGASLKYVNISELQPAEYVTTNVLGTKVLLDALLEGSDVQRYVGISSDKACLPVNTYGMTKALLEKLSLEASARQSEGSETKYVVARYGNVVGTRGSVVPFWRERMEQGLSLPVTDPDMTRFFFTIEEAVGLIDYALGAHSGAIVSKRMNACTVGDLAAAMSDGSPIEVIGGRPGEKRHEMLLSQDEMTRTVLEGDIFVFAPGTKSHGSGDAYSSDVAPQLSPMEIANLLEASEL